MKLLHCVLGCSLGLVACGSDGVGHAPNGEPSSAETDLSDVGSVAGIYTVPVSDAALQAVASFPVRVKVQQLPSGDVRMHYTLPAELVGTPQNVDFTGPANGALFGPSGTAQCTIGSADTICNERLPGTTVDMAGVAAALAARQVSDAQRSMSLRVSQTFSIDPIGVLRFSTSTSGKGHNAGR